MGIVHKPHAAMEHHKMRQRYCRWRFNLPEVFEEMPSTPEEIDQWFEDCFLEQLPTDNLGRYFHLHYAAHGMKLPPEMVLRWFDEEGKLLHPA